MMPTFRPFVAWPLRTLAAALLGISLTAAAPAGPRIFWASDPVRPDETVLLQGCDFAGASVEVARLADEAQAAPGKSAQSACPRLTPHSCGAAVPAASAGGTPAPQDVSGPAESPPWTRVPALQASESSLKCTLPAGEKLGIFACRVKAGNSVSTPVLLNAPDPWWLQGDEGRAATPGGWLRIFGKSLHFDKPSRVQLRSDPAEPVTLEPAAADNYALRLALPASLKPGRYAVRVHNGFGGAATWRPPAPSASSRRRPGRRPCSACWTSTARTPRSRCSKTLVKYNPVPDRTEGIQAALEKARHNGGGIVYFPAAGTGSRARSTCRRGPCFEGEGTGLVVLWWGAGRFNLDGGGQQGLARDPKAARREPNLISGREFGIEDMSLYLPLDHQTAISAADRFRMRRVRIRMDHLWALDGSRRPEGTIARLGGNFEVTDCDIMAKGTGLVPGRGGLVARNRILAGKTPCPLGGAQRGDRARTTASSALYPPPT